LLDPEKPIDAERLATELLPDEERPRAARRIATIAVLLGGIAALAALWRWGPLKDAVDVRARAVIFVDQLQPRWAALVDLVRCCNG